MRPKIGLVVSVVACLCAALMSLPAEALAQASEGTQVAAGAGAASLQDDLTDATTFGTPTKNQPTIAIKGGNVTGAAGGFGDMTFTAVVSGSYNEKLDFVWFLNGVRNTVSRTGDGEVSFTYTADEMNALPDGDYVMRVTSVATDHNELATDEILLTIRGVLITPTAASFDKYVPSDISIATSPTSSYPRAIKNGEAVLKEGTDYTYDQPKKQFVISRDYLKTLPLGETVLSFYYGDTGKPDYELPQHLTITVSDSTPTRNITVTQPAGGTVSVDPTSGKVGTTIAVSATPDAGYTLKAILVDGVAISGDTFVMKDADATVTAQFEPVVYDVTVTQAAGGMVSVDPTSGELGDTITVTATPDDGYTLKTILVDGVAISGDTFVLKDANATVTAEFEAVPKSPEAPSSGAGSAATVATTSSSASGHTATPNTGDGTLAGTSAILALGGCLMAFAAARKREKTSER